LRCRWRRFFKRLAVGRLSAASVSSSHRSSVVQSMLQLGFRVFDNVFLGVVSKIPDHLHDIIGNRAECGKWNSAIFLPLDTMACCCLPPVRQRCESFCLGKNWGFAIWWSIKKPDSPIPLTEYTSVGKESGYALQEAITTEGPAG